MIVQDNRGEGGLVPIDRQPEDPASTGGTDRDRGGLWLGQPIALGASGVWKRLRAFDRLVPLTGGRLLDVGCGNGAYTLELAKRFKEVVAIDVEPNRLGELVRQQRTSGQAGEIETRLLSAEAMDFEDGTFDAVTAIEVLEHVEDLPRAVREIARVLKPGGHLYVSVPNRWFPFETHTVRVGKRMVFDGRRLPFLPWIRPLHRRIATARNFSEGELRDVLTAAGLQRAGVGYVMPPFDHWAAGRRLIKPLTEHLERSALRALGVSIIAVYQKPTQVPAANGRLEASTGLSPAIPIIDLTLHDVSFAEAVGLIATWAQEGSGGYVYTPNVDDVVKARGMLDFRAAVQGARLRVPDGMGIVYGSRILGTPLRGTVTGRLLPAAVAAALGGRPPGIAFFGGRPDAVEGAARAITNRGGLVSAAISPPMDLQVGSSEDERFVSLLRESGAGVVFVSLGAPRQALWMARHASDLPASVLVGVGGAVDVLAGRIPAAPSWMTRVGLEWLFRLAHEPRRLARRYLVDDPRFYLWILAQRWSRATRSV
jgi:exopolysaccharide biosynthesis WecB/TagA/CpsF family protein